MTTDSKFQIDDVMTRIRSFVADMPSPSMFQLADEGYLTPFEQLVACMISIRTLEEVSLPVSRELFALARTPEAMVALGEANVERTIYRSTFADRKAIQIVELARVVADRYGGELPCDRATMEAFNGVGPKCANLALGIACGQATIPVDVHVHRVTNRWGYIATRTPEQSLVALEAILPTRYRPEINRLLVPFGKYHCTGPAPKCSTCPVFDACARIGVQRSR